MPRPDPDFDALMSLPRATIEAHANEFALMHDRRVINYFAVFRDALESGLEHYGHGEFTVQQVRTKPVQLGLASSLLSADE